MNTYIILRRKHWPSGKELESAAGRSKEVGEDMAGDVAVQAKTDLKPTHFGPGLSEQDITARYGQPDDQELTSIEGQNLAILHYAARGNKPKKTFGFVDNALVAVTIGFSFEGQRTTL